MEINFGRGDILVAQDLLDGSEIRAVFQKMSSETVSQRVNTLLINSARLGSDTDFILFLIVKFR